MTGCGPAPVRGSGYQLVFSEDFDGTVLSTNSWNTAPFGSSLAPVVGFNVVTIKSTAANNYMWGYVGSLGARSATEPNYPDHKAWQEGYFEARIRYSDNAWAWPAFWLYSMATTETWPTENCSHLISEWDIMENGVQNSNGTRPSNSWYFTALHRNTSDGTADGYCGQPDTQRTFAKDMTADRPSEWHTWAGRWTANEVCTYMDDVQLQCAPTFDTTAQPMHLAFTIQYLGQCTGCPPRPSELFLQVDWVHVWQK